MRTLILILSLVASIGHAEPYLLGVRAELGTALTVAYDEAQRGEAPALAGLERVVRVLFEVERQAASLDSDQRDAIVARVIRGAWADARQARPDLGKFFDPVRWSLASKLKAEARFDTNTWAQRIVKDESRRTIKRFALGTLGAITGGSALSYGLYSLGAPEPWMMAPLYIVEGGLIGASLRQVLTFGKISRRHARLKSTIAACHRALLW